MVDSPEYACQLVLVTKEVAVFQAVAAGTAGKPRASQRWFCTRWNA